MHRSVSYELTETQTVWKKNSFLKDFQLIFQIDNHLFSYQSSITSAGQAVYGQRLGHKLLDVLFQCVGIFCEEMVGKGYEILINFDTFCSTSILEFLHHLLEPTLASNSAFAIFTFHWCAEEWSIQWGLRFLWSHAGGQGWADGVWKSCEAAERKGVQDVKWSI